MARTTTSSLKHHKSSIDPPPRATISRSGRGIDPFAESSPKPVTACAICCSAPLLRARLDRAHDRLAALDLKPALLTRPLADRRDRLAAIARLAEQLHPERPLQRGYVMVLGAAGAAVTEAAAARKEPGLTLKFRDGSLDVVPAGSPRPPRSRTVSPTGNQPKLL